MMGKKITIDFDDLKEGLSRGCDYAGTQEVVHESFLESIEELGGVGDWDEMAAVDLEGQICILQSLFEIFYDKTLEKILNFIESYEEEQDQEECKGCEYYGIPSDAPETVEKGCLWDMRHDEEEDCRP